MHKHTKYCGNVSTMITFSLKHSTFKYSHSTSIKSHQLKWSVPTITTPIIEELSERFCLIDACVVCLTGQENNYKNFKNFRSNDTGTYLVTLKIVKNNVMIDDILNEKFLKSHSHLPEKIVFISWIKAL